MSVTLDSVAISSVAIPTVEEASVTGGGGGPPPPTGLVMTVGFDGFFGYGFDVLGGYGSLSEPTFDGQTIDALSAIQFGGPGTGTSAADFNGGSQVLGTDSIDITYSGGAMGTPPGAVTHLRGGVGQPYIAGAPAADLIWAYLMANNGGTVDVDIVAT